MITLQNLIDRGYSEYSVPIYLSRARAQKFFQKKVKLSPEDEFYIDVYIYDFRSYDPQMGVDFVFECQFNAEYPGTAFNISTLGWKNEEPTLERVEEFFTELYMFSKRFRKLKEDK